MQLYVDQNINYVVKKTYVKYNLKIFNTKYIKLRNSQNNTPFCIARIPLLHRTSSQTGHRNHHISARVVAYRRSAIDATMHCFLVCSVADTTKICAASLQFVPGFPNRVTQLIYPQVILHRATNISKWHPRTLRYIAAHIPHNLSCPIIKLYRH